MAQEASGFVDRTSLPTVNEFKIQIFSNAGEKSVDLTGGFIELRYYESILSDTMRVEYVFTDTGNSIDKKSVVDGLPLVGTEKVSVLISDNNKVVIKSDLYVNKVTPILDDTSKEVLKISLVSKEFLMDKKVNLTERFDGKISDTVGIILKDTNFLGTEKNITLEPTLNNYSFIGNNKRPLYTLNWLAKKSVSEESQTLGETSGYFLYETSKGYHFKSVDGLTGQEKKKSYIYNDSPFLPKGYDGKALTYDKDNLINASDKFKIGAYDTRIVVFDPFTTFYEVINRSPSENNKLAGKELPKFNAEFDTDKPFTRTTYYVLDTGTIPVGTTEQQLKKSKEENFVYKDIVNQSTMRYNQFFSAKASITIAGDFSLHAGDAIFLDVPKLEEQQTENINSTDGGLYIITDLCHLISPDGTYTKLNLVRDSFGRKGNHISDSVNLQGVI